MERYEILYFQLISAKERAISFRSSSTQTSLWHLFSCHYRRYFPWVRLQAVIRQEIPHQAGELAVQARPCAISGPLSGGSIPRPSQQLKIHMMIEVLLVERDVMLNLLFAKSFRIDGTSHARSYIASIRQC